ncbi:MAG: ABC transporter ATP-binding protein [Desulfovibrionaceae bacterium]|nr:ABC transporter ATP-binding protein [Desulfovibrionaceae bacterium]
MRVVAIENGTIAFATENGIRTVIKDIDFSIHEGEKIALYAPNGSGKTSLLRAMTGLNPLTCGRVLFHETAVCSEKDFARLRRSVGYVIQEAADQIFFPRVLEDTVFGPLNLGLSPEDAEKRALQALATLGIDSLANRETHHLSGGELRLVALAGILAMEPEVLLLDEPTNALDAASTKRLTDILRKLPTAQLTVSHDSAFLRNVAETFYTIRDGNIVHLPDFQAFA